MASVSATTTTKCHVTKKTRNARNENEIIEVRKSRKKICDQEEETIKESRKRTDGTKEADGIKRADGAKRAEGIQANELTRETRNNDDPNKNAKESEEKVENDEENEVIIKALKIEIVNLKKKVAEQVETIDYLVQEREEESDEVYKLKLKLADAWNIKLTTDAEKVREVARLVRLNEGPKSYRDAAKEADMNQGERNNGIATDSGIDMQSLEKLIDERVAVTMDAKFERNMKNKADAITRNSRNEFTKIVYTNKAEINDYEITPTMISDQQRGLNIIVHGLKEDGMSARTNPIVKELFDTLEMKHHPTTSADRLGAKSPVKIRPIRVTMESYERKRQFMSSLWRLKHGPDKFQKISITDDYTQEERREIKRWVDEAKKRTQMEDGYVWKVRGSPRSKIRLVRMSR